MPLGSYVIVCPNCDLIAPTADLTPCCQCGTKKYCSDCAVATNDPDMSGCSISCASTFNWRLRRDAAALRGAVAHA